MRREAKQKISKNQGRPWTEIGRSSFPTSKYSQARHSSQHSALGSFSCMKWGPEVSLGNVMLSFPYI